MAKSELIGYFKSQKEADKALKEEMRKMGGKASFRKHFYFRDSGFPLFRIKLWRRRR